MAIIIVGICSVPGQILVVCVCMCVYACICVRAHVCMHVCAFMCVHAHVCVSERVLYTHWADLKLKILSQLPEAPHKLILDFICTYLVWSLTHCHR